MAGVAEAHVIVSGRVQGVWFRGNTQRVAAAAGVHGGCAIYPTAAWRRASRESEPRSRA